MSQLSCISTDYHTLLPPQTIFWFYIIYAYYLSLSWILELSSWVVIVIVMKNQVLFLLGVRVNFVSEQVHSIKCPTPHHWLAIYHGIIVTPRRLLVSFF